MALPYIAQDFELIVFWQATAILAFSTQYKISFCRHFVLYSLSLLARQGVQTEVPAQAGLALAAKSNDGCWGRPPF